jgi:hypothetical protein
MPFRVMALLLVLVSPVARAEVVQLDHWQHGAWRVALTEDTAYGVRACRVWTGGDGLGTVSFHVNDRGGDATLAYEPVWFRGMPPPFDWNETVGLVFDGQSSGIGPALEIVEWVDEWGAQRMDASITNALVAEAVALSRRSNTLIVTVAGDGPTRVNDTFLLDGFTATWLKASEWCRFDADKRFQTS